MNTFIHVMSILIGLGGAVSLWAFRKGGIYNPVEPKDFTELPYLPPTSPETASVAPIQPETVTTSSAPKKPTIADFCLAISAYEGGPGDASHRNNNPGNVRYNQSGYMPMYGVVKCSPAGFAIFKDWNTGMLYLNNMVKGMVHKRPNETILQFMERYAPSSENDPTKYAQFLAKRLAVDISTKMSVLV